MALVLLAVGGVVASVTGSFCRSYFSTESKLKRELSKVALSPIAAARPGQVLRLRGVVVDTPDGPPLVAPISGRRCYAWRVQLVDQSRNDQWDTIHDEQEARAFLIEDDSAQAEVAPQGIELVAAYDRQGMRRRGGDHPPELVAFCTARDISLGGDARQQVRYREAVIETGEDVHVVGIGEWASDPRAPGESYRGSGRRLRLGPLGNGKLLVSDRQDVAPT